MIAGCYQDSTKPTLLTQSSAKLEYENVKDECLKRCRWQRYPLAGIRDDTCLCGYIDLDKLKKFVIDEQNCNRKCPENKTNKCSVRKVSGS